MAPAKTQTKKQAEQIYVATDTGVTDIDGTPSQYFRGKTRVREGHPLLAAAPHSFKPVDVHYGVEDATSDPS
jgi:hypothetical protein